MKTVLTPLTPGEIAADEGITPESCIKAAWAITQVIDHAMRQVEEFTELFEQFTSNKEIAPILRDAAGVAWALDQFVGLQWGQLPYWLNDARVAPERETQNTRHAA